MFAFIVISYFKKLIILFKIAHYIINIVIPRVHIAFLKLPSLILDTHIVVPPFTGGFSINGTRRRFRSF